MAFRNNLSVVGFIGNYGSVEEVITIDTRELEEIHGSFEAIADRMKQINDFAEQNFYEVVRAYNLAESNFVENFRIEHGGGYENIRFRAMITEGKSKLREEMYKLKMDDKVTIIDYHISKGGRGQLCPYDDCQFHWGDATEIVNSNTNRKIIINTGIEHLSRAHNFLEKGNEYGIGAKEFYEHFMLSNTTV